MNSARTIVVAVRDETSGQIALQRALRLAQSPQDRIFLVHVVRLASWQRVAELLTPQWLSDERQADPERHGWLRRLAESATGRTVAHEVLDGEPGPAIVEFARRVQASLILVAPPRAGQVRELFLGSTALRILRTSACPVLVARGRTTAVYAIALLAVDLDPSGQRVADAAVAWLPDARIDLVHGYRVPQEGQLRINGHSEEAIGQLRGLMKAEVEAGLEKHRSAFPAASFHVEHGFATSVLLDLTMRLQPDLVVLGRHRGSGTDEQLFGSVAQFMLYNCPADILLVP